MSTLKRRNPRRPFTITPEGLRRIVLGQTCTAATGAVTPIVPSERNKPLRLRRETTAWHVAIAHADRGSLDEAARQAIAAAVLLATPETGVAAVILGPYSGPLADLGADEVIVAPDLAGSYDPDRDIAFVSAVLDRYAPLHIFLADKPDGDGDLGRRIAAGRGLSAATRVVELTARSVAIRWAGRATLAEAPLPQLVLLAPGAVDPTLPFVGLGERQSPETFTHPRSAPSRIRDLGLVTLDATDVALEEADLIVSAGNGVANIEILGALAHALKAPVGASRVAVDTGKCARSQQIGATGKTVTATTYIAVGISGAVQHLQGIKDCRHVIAVNRDPAAPIAGRADLTIVGDAEPIMQALTAAIADARRSNSDEERSS